MLGVTGCLGQNGSVERSRVFGAQYTRDDVYDRFVLAD
jgi:hypothetical protein